MRTAAIGTEPQVAALAQCLSIVTNSINSLRSGPDKQAKVTRLVALAEHIADDIRAVLGMPAVVAPGKPRTPRVPRNTIREKRR
jgi:hypothetical protein